MVTYSSARLAGFLTAYAVSLLATEKSFTPTLGRINQDDTTSLTVVSPNENFNVNELLATYAELSKASALIKQDQIELKDGKIFDCITVNFVEYGDTESALDIVELRTPYTPKKFMSKLKVHTPKLVFLPEALREEKYETGILEAFIFGSGEHEEGSGIWDKALDESI